MIIKIVKCGGIIALFFFISWLFEDIIPPRIFTQIQLLKAQRAIEEYVQLHHKTPRQLSDLYDHVSDSTRFKDAWGRSFLYTPESDGSVKLVSSGEYSKDDGCIIKFSVTDNREQIADYTDPNIYNELWFIESLIRDYVAIHHQIPPGLFVLSGLNGHLHPLKNEVWEQYISYHLQGNGSVVLSRRIILNPKGVFSLEFKVPITDEGEGKIKN